MRSPARGAADLVVRDATVNADSQGPAVERIDVHLWFDPVCPWAWLTSRWLLEAARVRPLRPRWHVMSLSVLNEERAVSTDYARLLAEAWGTARACIAVAERSGEEALGHFYTSLGTLLHARGLARTRETVTAALADAGLPADLVEAMDDPAYDAALRASHQDGIGRVGTDVGTPVLSVGEVAFFGPVVSPAPSGEAAGRLWDGVLLVAGTEGFFEIKRTRDRPPAVR